MSTNDHIPGRITNINSLQIRLFCGHVRLKPLVTKQELVFGSVLYSFYLSLGLGVWYSRNVHKPDCNPAVTQPEGKREFKQLTEMQHTPPISTVIGLAFHRIYSTEKGTD
jgi:hypothetical protein